MKKQDQKYLEDRKPIEPEGKSLKDLIIPKKNLGNKLGLLMGLIGLSLMSSGLNYDSVKNLHQEKKLSRYQIERRIHEFPSKGKDWHDKTALYVVRELMNTGYWGREYYYNKHNLDHRKHNIK